MAVIGFDIGGTRIRGVALAANGLIEATERFTRPDDPDELISDVAACCKRLADKIEEPLEAVGAGCAGIVDRDGVVRVSPNIPTLIEYPLVERLTEAVGVPVAADNDNTVACWAEHLMGAGQGVTDMVFVGLGTGIGVGFVVDGGLRSGAHGFAGESGHMIIEPQGVQCVCGRRGCWEMYASGGALGRIGKRWAADGRAPRLLQRANGDVESIRGEHITALIHEEDPTALAMLDELAGWVAIGLNNLTMAFDPQLIVIGGGLSEMGPPLIDAIRTRFDEIMVDRDHRPPVRIRAAALSGRAGAIGAALVARERLLP